MESCLGELCNRTQPDDPSGSRAPSDDPSCHPAHPVSSDTQLPRTGLALSGEINVAECGGAPPTTQLGDPCGSTVPMIADEGDACRLSRPCKSSTTLCHAGVGIQNNTSHVAIVASDEEEEVPHRLTRQDAT